MGESRVRRAANLSPPPSRPAVASDGCLFFIALYSYDPATMSPNPGAVDDELPFKEGDVIKVSVALFWSLKNNYLCI